MNDQQNNNRANSIAHRAKRLDMVAYARSIRSGVSNQCIAYHIVRVRFTNMGYLKGKR